MEEAIAQQGRYVVEYRIRNCHERECWVSETGHALYNDSGQAVGLEGYIRDITALKQAETNLIEAYALLEKQQDLIRTIESYYQAQLELTPTELTELNSWVMH
jgi:ADP-glucose pyrophosphorylase